MPHVATQWHSDPFQQQPVESPSTPKLEKATSTEYLRPVQISIRRSRRTGGLRPTPSLSVLAARETEQWNYASLESDWGPSLGGKWSPKSATESVFDLYTDDYYGSPNSSTHSSFVAELEDTAPITRSCKTSRRSAPPSSNKEVYISPSSMEFRSTQLSARAVIKVVDETIAAIEDDNRRLLTRAMAAEEVAKTLIEENSQLHLRIESDARQTRSRTAPSSPVSETRPRCRKKATYATPLSVFNATIDELIVAPRPAKERARSEPTRPPPYPDPFTSPSPRTPLSAPDHRGLLPSPVFSSRQETQMQALSKHHRVPSSPPPRLQDRRLQTQAQPDSQPQLHSPFRSPLRSPGLASSSQLLSPNTIPRHVTRCRGPPLSCNTQPNFNDARTEKPLPPLGPMSPSVLSGLVEIGTPIGRDEWGREVKREEEAVGRRRRGLSELFRRAKGETIWK